MIKLVNPSRRYKDSYLEFLQESQKEGRNMDLNIKNLRANFESFIKQLNGYREGISLPKGYVPESRFWLVNGNNFIGSVSIRHHLTGLLNKVGGHIGYEIRSNERKKGYGKKILSLALKKAKQLGIKKALITCDITNIGSKKIIEANGGVLDSIEDQGKEKPNKLRYWINLS